MARNWSSEREVAGSRFGPGGGITISRRVPVLVMMMRRNDAGDDPIFVFLIYFVTTTLAATQAMVPGCTRD